MAHAASVSPEDQDGGRRVVVGTVRKKALDGLDVGFDGALHTHHSLLKERNDLQRWFPAEEDLVGRKPPPVGLGGRPVGITERPEDGGKPQAVVIGVRVRDGAQVDAWVGDDVAARGIAAFELAPYSALHDLDLYGRARSGVLPTNADSIPKLRELPTGEIAATINPKTSRSSHVFYVSQKTLDILGGV